MSDHATPRWIVAQAEELDCVSHELKQRGRESVVKLAARLRRVADTLEQRI